MLILSFRLFPCQKWHSIKHQKILQLLQFGWHCFWLAKTWDIFIQYPVSQSLMLRDFYLPPWKVSWWIKDDCRLLERKYGHGILLLISDLNQRKIYSYRNNPGFSYSVIAFFGTNSVSLPGNAASPLLNRIVWSELRVWWFWSLFIHLMNYTLSPEYPPENLLSIKQLRQLLVTQITYLFIYLFIKV